jgi:tRNA (mo5U34)-methyltransferase
VLVALATLPPVSDIWWFHSIDLGASVTPGLKSPETLDEEWNHLRLPDLAGKSVLDIGCWDGYFSFRAEREGAERVVALDHYVWSMNLPAQQAYYRECKAAGVDPVQYHERADLWDPVALPGKAGFDTAHRAIGSRVEPVVAEFATTDLAPLGRFDVVLFLGVLYHLEDPLAALRRLRAVTRELAVIETVASSIEGHESTPLFEFFPVGELDGDVGNWWAGNEAGLHGMCRAAGFTRVETVAAAPLDSLERTNGIGRYRIVLQARP